MSNYADASPIRSVGCTSEDWTAKEGSGPLAYRRSANDCAGMANSWRLEIAAGGGRRGPSVHNSTSQTPGFWSAGSTNATAWGCAFRMRSTVSSCWCGLVGRQRLDGLPGQEEPHAAALGRLPVLGEHFQPIRAKPRQIFAAPTPGDAGRARNAGDAGPDGAGRGRPPPG